MGIQELDNKRLLLSLKRYKDILKVMSLKDEEIFIDEAIEYFKYPRKNNIDKPIEKLNELFYYYKVGNENIVKKYNLKFYRENEDLNEKWQRLTIKEKEKLTRVELLFIYNVLCKKDKPLFLNKHKEELIAYIDIFVYGSKNGW